MNLPSITCLCITRGKKIQLERAIRCFKSQTYLNKDLLLVYEDDDPIADDVISNIKDSSISYLKVPAKPKLTLGELRNLSVQNCKGDFFCQWDDDDWYHNKRLECQMNGILNNHKAASLLTHWIMFDTFENQAYLSHINLWEGSILCDKSVFKDDVMYEQIPKGEDTFLIEKLKSKNHIYPLVMPQLYVYIFDGNNTFERDHFEAIYEISQKFSAESSLILKNIIENKIDEKTGSDILSSEMILSPLKYY
jgi:glycosyltransferase involved in cell wall biosynthesis